MPPTTLITPALKCDVAGCKDPVLVKKRRLCRRHYTRWQRYGSPIATSTRQRPPMRMSPEDRFFSYAIQDGDHWMWGGPTLGREVCDYGRLFMGDGASPRLMQAHRWSYEFFIGPIPDDLEPDHTCEVTLCVNPWHLDLVPHGINVRRGKRWPGPPAGRKPGARTKRDAPRETCPRCGDPYVTYENGDKRCRSCTNATMREWWMRTHGTGEGAGARNREKTRCTEGHEYTPENTYVNPKTGGRDCKKCRKRRNAENRERARQRKHAV